VSRGTKSRAGLAGDLLEAATALISERGPQGFSLREVARRARVSEAAPYWHFSSKEALLAAVAEQGFVALAAAMTEVRARVKDPRRRLRELGVAYVDFALAHPAHLRIMFGAGICDKDAHPSLHAAGDHAFGEQRLEHLRKDGDEVDSHRLRSFAVARSASFDRETA
jgi:AcrR family transcriptional regulator